jgi:hypothetical protein
MSAKSLVFLTLVALVTLASCGSDAGRNATGDAAPDDALPADVADVADVAMDDAGPDASDAPRVPMAMAFERIAPGMSDSIRAVHVGPGGEIFAGGGFPGVRCFCSGSWRDHAEGISPLLVTGLWGDASGLKLAGGGANRIWNLDGSSWTLAAEIDSSCSVGAKVFGLRDGYGIGMCSYYSGVVRFKVGDPSATERASGLQFQTRDGFAFARDDAYVLATDGIRHYGGGPWADVSSWPLEPVPVQRERVAFQAIWAPRDAELVVVGHSGVVLIRRAGVWKAEDSVTDADLNDVWGHPQVGTYAVGSRGTVIFSDGTSWQVVPVPATADLHAIHGLPDGTVVIVGDDGTVLRSIR